MGAPYNTLKNVIKMLQNKYVKKKIKNLLKKLNQKQENNLQFWVGKHGYYRWILNKDWRFS